MWHELQVNNYYCQLVNCKGENEQQSKYTTVCYTLQLT